jgi:hypothetical protein
MTSRGKNAQDVADAVHQLADAAAAQYADYIDSGAVNYVKPDITPEATQP